MKMAKGYSQEKVERETTVTMELQEINGMLQKKLEEKSTSNLLKNLKQTKKRRRTQTQDMFLSNYLAN